MDLSPPTNVSADWVATVLALVLAGLAAAGWLPTVGW